MTEAEKNIVFVDIYHSRFGIFDVWRDEYVPLLEWNRKPHVSEQMDNLSNVEKEHNLPTNNVFWSIQS